jgi:hypothetical protein
VTYTDIIADEGLVDVIATSLTAMDLPEFWKFDAGGCNAGRMTFSADFTGGPFTCADFWGGAASGGGQFGGKTGPVHEGNTARIKFSWAVLPANAMTATAGTEYYVSRTRIPRSAAALACAGCGDDVCLVYNQEKLSLLSGAAPTIQLSSDAVNPPWITWQDAGNATFNCPVPTPVKARTWGEIKSLYR